MVVHGTIADLTFADAACGIVAWGGTLRIKLTQSIPGYRYDDVFVMVPCFPDFEKYGNDRLKYIDKSVALDVAKLYPEYKYGLFADIKKVPCPFEIITNKLDSKKVPFYCTGASVSQNIEALEKKHSENH